MAGAEVSVLLPRSTAEWEGLTESTIVATTAATSSEILEFVTGVLPEQLNTLSHHCFAARGLCSIAANAVVTEFQQNTVPEQAAAVVLFHQLQCVAPCAILHASVRS